MRAWGDSGRHPGRMRLSAGGELVPRFVILEHDYPELHWDFMLEAGAVLKTCCPLGALNKRND